VLLISPYHKDIKQVSGGIANWTKNFIGNPTISSQITVRIVNTRLIGRRATGSTKYNYLEEVYRLCKNVVSLFIQLAFMKPDIVHLNSSCSNFGLVRDSIFSRIIKIFNRPLVVHFHCNVAYYSYSKRAYSCLSRLVVRANKLLVLNKPSQKYIIEKFAKESVILPLYIPNDKLRHITQRKVEETIKCIVFVGHITENKGCDIIIKIAEMLPQVRI
jgi:glycosyltransferase involved in cell wall biosynthesis